MSVRWKQADYLNIARVLHEMVTNDSLENWKLRKLSYELSCSETEDGLQYIYLYFYRDTVSPTDEARWIDQIIIDPQRELVRAHIVEETPNWMKLPEINLSQLSITGETALQIAEQNGGYEVRMKEDNDCSIFVELREKWIVYYDKDGGDYFELFKMNIDAITGGFEMVYPEP